MFNIVQFLSPSLGVENCFKSQLLTLKDTQTQTKLILFSQIHTESFPDLYFVLCRSYPQRLSGIIRVSHLNVNVLRRER